MNFRTISQLPSIGSETPLLDNDLFEVSKIIASDRYQSFKITTKELTDDIKEKAINGLLTDSSYGFSTTWNMISSVVNGMVYGPSTTVLSGNITFKNSPTTTQSFENFDNNNNYKKIVNVETLKNFASSKSPFFIGKDTKFTTEYFNVENNLTLSTSTAPSVNGEKHNEYLFRINNFMSNSWITTSSGIFTCYGWVDQETEGTPDNSNKWVALEGKIGDGDNPWKILQLQPFVPNVFCSYVGFTFPVNVGLELRIRTGFRVGTNSNKYQSYQGSLTNHIANAFVGGVYRTDV